MLLSAPVLAAGENTDKSSDFSMLEALGIFEGTGISGDEQEISRAQFAVCVYNLFKYENYGSGAGTQFIDVEEDHFASKAVNALYELKLVSGISSEFFAPDSPISINEAIKILISGLGYGRYADLNGGYPAGYYSIAGRLKILPQGSADAAVSAESLVYILKNVMKVRPVEPSGVSDAYITYEEQEKSIGEKNFDLYKGKGAVSEIIPAGYGEVQNSRVIIEGAEYDAGGLNVFDLIGRYIEFWYTLPDDYDRGTILSVSDEGNVVTFDSDDIISFSDGTYQYYENGKMRTVKVESYASIYLNGKEVPYSEDLMCPLHGSVSVMKYGNEYCAVIVSSYVNAYVSRSDKENSRLMLESAVRYKKIENGQIKDGSTMLIDALTSNYYFFLYNKDGIEKTISSLTDNTLVSIYFDPYGEGARIYAGPGFVSGTVKSIDDSTVTIDDRTYNIFYELISDTDVYTGMNGIFALDCKGNIAYVTNGAEVNSGNAFFINAYIEDGTEDRAFAVLVDIGKRAQVTYEIKTKVRANGESYTIKDEASLKNLTDLFKESFYVSATVNYSSPAFVRYKTDSSGKIVEFDTVSSPKYPDLRKINTYEAGMSKLLVNTTLNTIGDKVLYNDATVFADVPYTAPEDEAYLKHSGQMISFMDKYMMASNSFIGAYVDVYYFEDSDTASLIVKHSKRLTSSAVQDAYMPRGTFTDFGMLIECSEAIDENGDICDKIKFINADGSEKEYPVMSGYSSESNEEYSLLSEELECGDIFAYNVQNGYAGNFVKVYDCSNEEPMSALIGAPLAYSSMGASDTKLQAVDEPTATSGKYNTIYRISVGRAYALRKNVLRVALGNTADDSNLGYFNIDTSRIIVYTSDARKKDKIKKGTTDDIKTLEHFGNEASKVGVYIKSGRTVTLFVYN